MTNELYPPIAVICALALFVALYAFGNIISLIIAIGLMVVLTALSEGSRNAYARAGSLAVVLIMNLAIFTFLFPGNLVSGLIFAALGVAIVYVSRGHIGRALALSFLSFPILLGLLLSGQAPSDSLHFAGFAILLSALTVALNLLPAGLFVGTGISEIGGLRMSSPSAGLYWSSAFSLYLLQNYQSIASYQGLVESGFVWALTLVVIQEGGGILSMVVVPRLAPSYVLTINVLDSASRRPLTGAQVSLRGTQAQRSNKQQTSGPNGTVTFKSIPSGTYTLNADAPNFQQATTSIAFSSSQSLSILLTAVPPPQPPPPTPTLYRVSVSIKETGTQRPIRDAKVELLGKQVTSNSRGIAVFRSIPAGRQTLTVSATGFNNATTSLDVPSALGVDVVLTPLSQLPPTQKPPPQKPVSHPQSVDPEDWAEEMIDISASVLDPELRSGTVKTSNATGITKPLGISGSYATVFQVDCPQGRSWALRCFLSSEVFNSIHVFKQRYDYLMYGSRGGYFVESRFIQDGIRMGGRIWPIVKMQWIKGETLHDFLSKNYRDRTAVAEIAELFLAGQKTLQLNEISHGDLSSTNVMVLQSGGRYSLKLIDYDSIYSPTIKHLEAPQPASPNYRHPAISKANYKQYYSPRSDNFATLVIYLSLLAISEKPRLWTDFNLGIDGETDESKIILETKDFAGVGSRPIWHELEGIQNDKVTRLRDLLIKAIGMDPLWDGIDANAVSAV